MTSGRLVLEMKTLNSNITLICKELGGVPDGLKQAVSSWNSTHFSFCKDVCIRVLVKVIHYISQSKQHCKSEFDGVKYKTECAARSSW